MTAALPDVLLSAISGHKGRALFITRNNRGLGDTLEAATPDLDWTVITKEDLRGAGVTRLVSILRSSPWQVLVLEDRQSELTRRRDLYRMLLILARSRSRWLIGSAGQDIRVTRVSRRADGLSTLAAGIAEGWATATALIRARMLSRRLDKPLPRGTTVPGKRVAMLKSEFWFDLEAGGSVSHALGVFGGMRDLGLEPRLWTTSLLPDPHRQLTQTRVEPASRPSFIEEAAVAGFNRTFVERAGEAIKRFQPSLVYHRHDAFSLVGLWMARLLKVPLVLEVNSSEVWVRRTWSRLSFPRLAEEMERVAFRRASRLVLVSEELVDTVVAAGGDRSRVVVNPNGVNVDRFDPDDRGEGVRKNLDIPPDAVVCGFIGTFTRWHGVLFLAEQVPAVVSRNKDIYFLFLGDGDLRGDMELRLKDRAVSRKVRFTGLLAPRDVPRHLAACDILLSPHLPFEDGTEFFGSPTKLFEYMAAGRAIVAARLGQIGRILEHDRTGILFTPGDGREFQSAILGLSADPETRDRFGREARKTAENTYTWKANVRRALRGLVELPGE